MKKIIFIALLLIMAGCTNSQTQTKDNPELDVFISALDDKSLEEIKGEVNVNIKQFDTFIKFFDKTFANKIEKIKKENEKYDSIFKIDTTSIGRALHQFNNIVFNQGFNDYQSVLKFAFGNPEIRRPLALGQGVSQSFIPNKIYYHNGDVKTDSVAGYEVDFSFDNEWGKTKPIDSIDITYKVNYLKDYDVVEVSVDNPKANYKNGQITLVKTQDNYAYITFSDTISDYVTVQGYNAEGKILYRKGSSSNAIAPKDSKGIFTEMGKYFKILQEKLKDGDFKTTGEFQEYLRENLGKLDYFNDKDGLSHNQYYYYGKINSLKIYFEKDTESRQVEFTAKNVKSFNNKDELFAMGTENELVFLNTKGEPKITINGSDWNLENIGGDFYEDYNYFYHLNRTEKRLDTLLVYDIKAFSNGLVGLKPEQRDDGFSLFTFDNKSIGDKKYSSLKEVGNILFGLRDNKYFILDEQGNETLVAGVTKIHDNIIDNRILVENSNNKFGFIDSKGKIAIPFKYNNAKDFEDGITAVKFNGTCKLIDINGKVLVDTEEDYIGFFGKDDHGKRIYKFNYGKKRYNYKGELIEK